MTHTDITTGTETSGTPDHSASTLELFFDLVFVFAFTQVTGFLAHHLTWAGMVRGTALLAAVWWTWSSYTWLTGDIHAKDILSQRVAIFAAMGAMLVVALSIPNAFGSTALLFGVAFFVVRLLHVILFKLAAPPERRAGVYRIAPGILGGPALIVIASVVGEPVQSALWAVALGIDYGVVYFRSIEEFHIYVEHFVERFQLIVIIALGESIVAIGVGVGAGGTTLGPLVVVVAALLGFTLIAVLWWLYFDYIIFAAEQHLSGLSGYDRTLLARDSYSVLHLPLIGSIIFLALGLEQTLAHVGEPLGLIAAVALCGGSALYLVGHTAWRFHDHGTYSGPRVIAAVVACVLIGVTVRVPAVVALAILVVLFVGLAAFETVYSADRREFREQQSAQ
jgi:low temperature requirement protein LtrA